MLNKRTGGLFERNGIMLLAQVDIEEVSTPVSPSPLKPNALMPGKSGWNFFQKPLADSMPAPSNLTGML